MTVFVCWATGPRYEPVFPGRKPPKLKFVPARPIMMVTFVGETRQERFAPARPKDSRLLLLLPAELKLNLDHLKRTSHLNGHVRPDGRGAREFGAGRRTRRSPAGATTAGRGNDTRLAAAWSRESARRRSAAPPRPSSVATWRGGHYHRTTATTAQPLSPALVAVVLSVFLSPSTATLSRADQPASCRHFSSSVCAPAHPEELHVCHLPT